jgi:diaminopimelate epimerase
VIDWLRLLQVPFQIDDGSSILLSRRFYKYHALGNDYLVIESDLDLNEASIRAICDRHYGIGSDGILLATKVDERDKDMTAVAGLCIFNPGGSEAEKSGNGIRIFCRYL